MSYKHLTATERESILRLSIQGVSIRGMAAALHRSPSTISRELSRNSSAGNYSALEAGKRYDERRSTCHRARKLEDPALCLWVLGGLQQGWSPEQICGRERIPVSVTTIYRALHSALLPHATKFLRRKGKPYKCKDRQDNRGRIVDAVSIEQRPDEANERLRIGDWELDTVLGKQGSGGLVTAVDRKSRFLLTCKVRDKSAPVVGATLLKLFKGMECRTLTSDNGKEFAWHREISKTLRAPFYFAHPHSPWERGTNENTNGLIREYLPKGTDFRDVTDSDVEQIAERLNNRPRKSLGFRTPREVFFNLPVALDLTI